MDSLSDAQRRVLVMLDLSRRIHTPRKLTERSHTIITVVNGMMEEHGLGEITTAQVRLGLYALGLLGPDKGNQWIGDTLGTAGLGLVKEKRKGATYYLVPDGGITREMIEARFTVPPDFDWGEDQEEEGDR